MEKPHRFYPDGGWVGGCGGSEGGEGYAYVRQTMGLSEATER